MYIEDEKRKLRSKLAYLEDKLLRSKNNYEIENLKHDLRILRAKLQKLQYQA